MQRKLGNRYEIMNSLLSKWAVHVQKLSWILKLPNTHVLTPIYCRRLALKQNLSATRKKNPHPIVFYFRNDGNKAELTMHWGLTKNSFCEWKEPLWWPKSFPLAFHFQLKTIFLINVPIVYGEIIGINAWRIILLHESKVKSSLDWERSSPFSCLSFLYLFSIDWVIYKLIL